MASRRTAPTSKSRKPHSLVPQLPNALERNQSHCQTEIQHKHHKQISTKQILIKSRRYANQQEQDKLPMRFKAERGTPTSNLPAKGNSKLPSAIQGISNPHPLFRQHTNKATASLRHSTTPPNHTRRTQSLLHFNTCFSLNSLVSGTQTA
jgi:hypothetical protein